MKIIVYLMKTFSIQVINKFSLYAMKNIFLHDNFLHEKYFSTMPWWIWLKCVLKWEKWISSKFFNFFLRFQRDIRQHYIIITYPKNIIWIHFKPYYSIFDSKTLHEIHISLMDFWLKIIKIWKIINLRTFWSKSLDL